ncbi:MAG: Bax inhibitor-1/YccA family protein [Deltaproteobacteria bacterium]|nr:Bax inhibitor-1/YccA family protein [Deltaproteobacteria bacterium]
MTDKYFRPQARVATAQSQALTNAFLRGVYLWMGLGLAVTAVVSWYVSGSYAIMNAIYSSSVMPIVLLVAWFGLAMGINAAISRISGGTATALFMLFSALTGVTLAPIFIVYTSSSIAATFASCAGMFGAMSVYGLVTKRDLTSWGSFLIMGLVGVIIASIVNMFMQSEAMHYIIGYVGVIVFLGLTAYDTQKLRDMGDSAPMDDATALRRGTILGALTLYLDFINLFLMLLRIFGDRR